MSDKCETFVARWDHAMCSTCGAAHAPTPTPAPGLDLDAVADTMRGLDNIFAQAMSSRDAEVRALRETVAMLRADIARYYDALTSERAKLAEVKRLQGQVAETAGYLRAELEPRGRTPSRTGVRELAARLEVIAAALEAL